MQFSSLSELLVMNGHGVYVWVAYVTTVLVILGNLFSAKLGYKKVLQQLHWQVQVKAKATSPDSISVGSKAIDETASSPTQADS